MGPKKKDAGKKKGPPVPEIDPKEVVTELQKEFFEFQLKDIEKKLNRISQREEDLTTETAELEEKIEEFKKERGAVIAEHEELLAAKEAEKCSKREEMLFLSEEKKRRIEKHKQRIQTLEQKYNDMVTELTHEIEVLEEEVRILEDYKQNKDMYHEALEKISLEMEEMEKQHQRNLFAIHTKCEKAKGMVKKELQSRLLHLSIEFRQKSQKKIGKPCHRVKQENKVLHTVLTQMKDEILEYEERSEAARGNMIKYKELWNKKQEENDKMIAKTIIQGHIKKIMEKQTIQLVDDLQTFTVVDTLNRNLLRKLNSIESENDRKLQMIDEVYQMMEDKIAETNSKVDVARKLKLKTRRLQILIRNALAIAEEAMAVRLIPLGMIEEEKHLTIERQIKLFRNRRDVAFGKKGRILQYLFDFLSKAQLKEDDKKLLRTSSHALYSPSDEGITFSQIYGKKSEQELKFNLQKQPEEEKKGPVFYTSLTSLPRSVSVLIEPEEKESEYEGYEGEFGEYGGHEIPQPLGDEEETETEGEDEEEEGEQSQEEIQEDGEKAEEGKKSDLD